LYKIAGADDIVSLEYGSAHIPGQLHGDAFQDASSNQIAAGMTAAIMRDDHDDTERARDDALGRSP
jgi:hypothetical protein